MDVTLNIMFDCGSEDLTRSVAEFKENLSDVIQTLRTCMKMYGDSIEIDELSDSKITCTLSIGDCPVDVEVEIVPSLHWDVENGKTEVKI